MRAIEDIGTELTVTYVTPVRSGLVWFWVVLLARCQLRSRLPITPAHRRLKGRPVLLCCLVLIHSLESKDMAEAR